FLCFYSYGDHRDLHSFPTRRSSDLGMHQHQEFRIYDVIRALPRSRPRTPKLLGLERREPPRLALTHHVVDRGNDALPVGLAEVVDRKSTRLNSSHLGISYAVFCLKK